MLWLRMATQKGAPRDRGPRGERGPVGHRGAKGERGPIGPTPTRAQILRVVQEEFDQIRTELRVQLERMAQIQRQVDSVERLLVKALSDTGAATQSD